MLTASTALNASVHVGTEANVAYVNDPEYLGC